MRKCEMNRVPRQFALGVGGTVVCVAFVLAAINISRGDVLPLLCLLVVGGLLPLLPMMVSCVTASRGAPKLLAIGCVFVLLLWLGIWIIGSTTSG